MSTKTERLDSRIDTETKNLALRAASVGQQSVSAYLTYLIRQDAPRRLKEHQEIVLANERFDQFALACERAEPLSEKILEAARKLDEEGL